MTQSPLPSRDVLKQQARSLRSDLAARGTAITHAEALETVAHQWGARDWNTAAALADDGPAGWTPGQRVRGSYLGHPFTGHVKAARQAAGGFWALTLRFDAAVDVVASDRFSSLRRQVNATVNARGRSPQKTSDGQPHLVVERA